MREPWTCLTAYDAVYVGTIEEGERYDVRVTLGTMLWTASSKVGQRATDRQL